MNVNSSSPAQTSKAKTLHALHHSGKLLILPNIWDCLGAKLLEDLEYPAIATASASVAFSKGYDDGEHVPFDAVLELLRQIVNSVNLPVTADIEGGYSREDEQLKQNIRRLIDTGIAGINFEDSDKKTGQLLPVDDQARRIRLIKNVADEMGTALFVNARTDVMVHPKDFDNAVSRQEEILRRALAYREAGADCFFPLAMVDETAIRELVTQIEIPVNILLIPGVPELQRLSEIGVARVSLGPSFLKIAIRAMKGLALQLKEMKGLPLITDNEITTAYLRELVNKPAKPGG